MLNQFYNKFWKLQWPLHPPCSVQLRQNIYLRREGQRGGIWGRMPLKFLQQTSLGQREQKRGLLLIYIYIYSLLLSLTVCTSTILDPDKFLKAFFSSSCRSQKMVRYYPATGKYSLNSLQKMCFLARGKRLWSGPDLQVFWTPVLQISIWLRLDPYRYAGSSSTKNT